MTFDIVVPIIGILSMVALIFLLLGCVFKSPILLAVSILSVVTGGIIFIIFLWGELIEAWGYR